MKGYWIVKVNDLHLDKQKIYKELATEAVKKFNGRFLVRDGKNITMEGREFERNVIVEYETFDLAKQAYNSDDYQNAKKILGEDKDRLFAIVEGVESVVKKLMYWSGYLIQLYHVLVMTLLSLIQRD